MLNNDELNWSSLVDAFSQFQDIKNEQIEGGLSNYCLLNTVLRKNDEVRLHGRFIASLINPNNPHLKKDYFLQRLQTLIPKENHFKYPENVVVEVEHFTGSVLGYPNHKKGFIDIYITDGVKHWIIENKLDASDQNLQMARYIDWFLYNSENEVTWEDITFIYLTKDRKEPSLASKDRFIVDLNKGIVTADDDIKCRYLNLHYNTDILNWLNLCIQGLKTNDSMIYPLEDYQMVLNKYLNKDTNKVVTLAKHLQRELKMIPMLRHIEKELPAIKANWLLNLFNKFESLLEENGVTEEVEFENYSDKKIYLTFTESYAKEWFTNEIKKNKNKDKGRFFKLTEFQTSRLGIGSESYIFLGYGKKLIHVGLALQDGCLQNDELKSKGFLYKKGWKRITGLECLTSSFVLEEEIWTLGENHENSDIWLSLKALLSFFQES
ncbi:PD-(D/E)XK nuclease family protein [Psychrosphaera aquimarina]|uniref:PD-(D/E)XK nuclease family protein n=1 Tax=Psychrosphaera aquimarina TaxID=2044854 RepID=A0ABU3QX85_9GAMM|nr:PD-(D/E)XK nuclease family protein [Psychrosphaera aquimarina]MDU0111770.1 PD-(D/E)XK nuclease family protein [Psychrosphaera aquimarina]